MSGRTANVCNAYDDSRFYHAIDGQTGYHTRNVLAVAMRNQRGEIIGAFEALNKNHGDFTPRDEESLEALASHAAISIETAQLIGELRRSQDELVEQNAHLFREVENRYAAHGIIGSGPRLGQVARLIERIRDSLVNVLVTGESGTGKEMVAKAIHYASSRARKRFVALNCAALPDTLVESELFGIEKGVATGVTSRIGQFREGRRGDPVPGRDRRPQPHRAGQDSAGAAGAHPGACRRPGPDSGGREAAGSHQQRPGCRDRARQLPRGSLLPH